MSTRTRALVVTFITTSIVFLGLADIFRVENLLLRVGIESVLVAEFVTAAIISLILVMGTWWILFFKRKGLSLLVIGTFPGMAVFPFLVLFESITSSIFSGFSQFTVITISTGIFALFTYLLLLTANVLNGAVLYDIPLGQAGKASQFIFSLISSYFLIALLFGAAYPIGLRVLLIGLFVLYFSYSTNWSQADSQQQAWLTAVSISMLMVLATILMSIWPVTSIYATLALVVFLYILLSIALEMREKITKIIWLEYFTLATLIVLILLTNGIWGIAGAVI